MPVVHLEKWPKWHGETVALLGGGPSLTLEQVARVERAHTEGRCRCIAINRSYALAPWADILYAGDRRWWGWHQEAQEIDGLRYPRATEFAGLKLTRQGPTVDGVIALGTSHELDIWAKTCALNHERDSGTDAMQIAAGCIKSDGTILLLGFDGECNGWWHSGYAKRMKQGLKWDKIFRHHKRLYSVFKQHGIKVVNCSPGSKIYAYPFRKLEDVL